MTIAVQIILGIVLLIAGRKLFWLFVGALGFVIGLMLATRFVSTDSQILLLVIALVAGLIGAGLAVAVQSFAVGVAGFLAGGYGLLTLLSGLNWDFGNFQWAVFVVGGVLGAILVSVLFEWALIILSSLTGASLLVQSFKVQDGMATVILIGLFVVGLAIQSGIQYRERARARLAAPQEASKPVQNPPKTS